MGPQFTQPEETSSTASVAILQHVPEGQNQPHSSNVQPPHGRSPRLDRHHQNRDVSPSYAASRSKALLRIKTQYASSDEEDDGSPYMDPAARQECESSISAYSSADREEGEVTKEPRGQEAARASEPSPLPRLNRRSRADRAVRNATWSGVVTEQTLHDNHALIAPDTADACAPIVSSVDADDAASEFKTPMFFTEFPQVLVMPVMQEEDYA
ncbi:hypothetical protein QAD02_020434 [Eretmocerus hayati]|uniref:Uncharacterized protein n=1 Tax=Eretmocerus hayati TaxID=131215 RepID=A0ACC2PPB2_9HYME|nr:hypothetical protein QAD02_020434 [Eretmocerus hayati]